ncbi:MAG: glycoside hydrolase family 97 catalytic domain-containing protein [Bacteroidales bacterium]|nr:glycoside hydrolase family 97 catalytic domain-containing protein [Candidatus Cryptobacteroides onthequi]
MLSKTVCFLILMLSGINLSAQKHYSVSSPDGNVCLEVTVGKKVTYTLSHGGEVLVDESEIAIETDHGCMGDSFRVRKAVKKTVNETYETPFYKRSHENSFYNELMLVGRDGYDLVLRAYNEGAAFRYESRLGADLTVLSETMDLNLPSDFEAWIPYVKKVGDFNVQFFNTFENVYAHTPVSEWREGQLAFLPVMFQSQGGKKFCVTESDLEHYPGMYLLGDGSSRLKSVFAPYPKTLRQGSHDPSVTVGGHNQVVTERENFIAKCRSGETFPWRVFATASSDEELLDNNLVYKLARPTVDADFSWVKPGKVAWDWWNDNNITGVDFTAGINNETYRYYIDFAAANGISYVVLDDGWYDRMAGDAFAVVPEIDLPGLISYAESRGVGLMLWVGYYVFQKDMEKVISHYAAMGIKGFKLDAIGRDDQLMNEFYYRSAQIALDNHVILDFHGGAKPSGLNRTYPNVLNFEGVHGLEQLKNPNYSCDLVTYDVTFPFIRSICGPVDYTQGAMRNGTQKSYRSVWSEPMSQGTRCRQLAEYVVFESPLCMLCDTPTNYIKEKECTAFISSVPTVWAETKIIDGKAGEYETIARQSRDGDWYVGSLASWEGRDAVLDLSFLGEGTYDAEIFQDGVNAKRNASDYRHHTRSVTSSDRLELTVAPGGGYVIRFHRKADDAAAQQKIINRYGLELVKGDGGYSLLDEKKIRKYDIFDIDNAPADMFVPYTRSRSFFKDEDFDNCETIVAVFKKYPGYELKIAFDLPKDYKGKAYPWIMWIHGGGWHIGDFNGHRLQSRFMAGNGIAGVRISYSLLTQGAVFQDTWQDIQDAFSFIREHAAEYGLDPDRFGFAGHSAGGHLATYAAMRIPGAKLLISMNGIYDLVHTVPEHVPSSRHNTYFNLPSTESRAECSPVTFVHEGAPYCLLTYTGGDTLVERAQVETFTRALDRCHVKYDLIYKEYYCHNGFNDTDLFEPWAMKMLVTAQQYLGR